MELIGLCRPKIAGAMAPQKVYKLTSMDLLLSPNVTGKHIGVGIGGGGHGPSHFGQNSHQNRRIFTERKTKDGNRFAMSRRVKNAEETFPDGLRFPHGDVKISLPPLRRSRGYRDHVPFEVNNYFLFRIFFNGPLSKKIVGQIRWVSLFWREPPWVP